MGVIPKAKLIQSEERIRPIFLPKTKDENIVFSFKAVERNEYFNLDYTCPNWSQELFLTMQTVSNINMKDVYAGKYSGKGSTLRIHQHQNAKSPCDLPRSVSLEDMWQIRISKSKGGVHGVFYENIFYVIWFDPHHNLYPDERYGGLKMVRPASSCCKDRDEELSVLAERLKEEKEISKFWEDYAVSIETNNGLNNNK